MGRKRRIVGAAKRAGMETIMKRQAEPDSRPRERKRRTEVMVMDGLRELVEAAAKEELGRENAKLSLFNGPHEGYAMTLEAVEDAQEAMENVKSSMGVLWDQVKGKEIAGFLIKDTAPMAIYHQAINAACEMIKAAAMLLKYETEI